MRLAQTLLAQLMNLVFVPLLLLALDFIDLVLFLIYFSLKFVEENLDTILSVQHTLGLIGWALFASTILKGFAFVIRINLFLVKAIENTVTRHCHFGPDASFPVLKSDISRSRHGRLPTAVGVACAHRGGDAWPTRRLSASYDPNGPRTSHPTTAFSSITASMSTNAIPRGHAGSVPSKRPQMPLASRTSSNLPLPSPNKQKLSITSNGTAREPVSLGTPRSKFLADEKDENVPPLRVGDLAMSHRDSLDLPATKLLSKTAPIDDYDKNNTPRPKPKGKSAIPRARTLNVLSNITTSLSRSSLSSFGRNESRHTSGSSVATIRSFNAPLGPAGGSMASGLSLTVPETCDSTTPDVSTVDQLCIHTAQSSEYWTGRFIALSDRLRSEVLSDYLDRSGKENTDLPSVETIVPKSVSTSNFGPNLANADNRRHSHRYSASKTSNTSSTSSLLPQSQSTGTSHGQLIAPPATDNLAFFATKSKNSFPGKVDTTAGHGTISSPATPSDDEDNRCRRVFLQLEAFCTTNEARKSLHAWQQSYARRMGKACLLPRGGSMEDKGWVGRLLGSATVSRGLGSGSAHGRKKRGSFAF